jgi:hypothetical protein
MYQFISLTLFSNILAIAVAQLPPPNIAILCRSAMILIRFKILKAVFSGKRRAKSEKLFHRTIIFPEFSF